MRHLELKNGSSTSRLGLVIKSGPTYSLVTGFNFKSADFDLDLFDKVEARHPAVRAACTGEAISIAPAQVGQEKSDFVCFNKEQLVQGKLD